MAHIGIYYLHCKYVGFLIKKRVQVVTAHPLWNTDLVSTLKKRNNIYNKYIRKIL